eukprot:m.49398 g.49398  ORF g.49398 m.49398 type:complete len:500 (+) comp16100_c0_seq2:234-1733(+)
MLQQWGCSGRCVVTAVLCLMNASLPIARAQVTSAPTAPPSQPADAARFIRIFRSPPGGTHLINLGDVMPFDCNGDYIRPVAASQSAGASGQFCEAFACIDGLPHNNPLPNNAAACTTPNSLCHTGQSSSPFFQADLGSPMIVSRVVVLNRNEGRVDLQARINGFRIGLFAGSGGTLPVGQRQTFGTASQYTFEFFNNTCAPSPSPTAVPSGNPTVSPTAAPSAAPSSAPTAQPSPKPSLAPTALPTATPTAAPTSSPSPPPTAPTLAPTVSPTDIPSHAPTMAPTAATRDGGSGSGVALTSAISVLLLLLLGAAVACGVRKHRGRGNHDVDRGSVINSNPNFEEFGIPANLKFEAFSLSTSGLRSTSCMDGSDGPLPAVPGANGGADSGPSTHAGAATLDDPTTTAPVALDGDNYVSDLVGLAPQPTVAVTQAGTTYEVPVALDDDNYVAGISPSIGAQPDAPSTAPQPTGAVTQGSVTYEVRVALDLDDDNYVAGVSR